jgi:hypothetical protein
MKWRSVAPPTRGNLFTDAAIVPGGILFRCVDHGTDSVGAAVALQFVPCDPESAERWIREANRNV